MFPFFPFLSFFFKVRVRTISIVNARSRRRIFFCAWFAIEWRSLRTSNIRADERGVQAMSLRLSWSLVLPHRSCRYVTHQGGRASEGCDDDRYACCRRSCSPTRYVTRATLRVYCDMGLLGFCEEHYIF